MKYSFLAFHLTEHNFLNTKFTKKGPKSDSHDSLMQYDDLS